MADIEKIITPDSTLEKTRKRLKGFDINSNLHQATTDSFKLGAETLQPNDTILHFTNDNFITLNGRLYGTGGGFYYLNPLYEKMNNGTKLTTESQADNFVIAYGFSGKLPHVYYNTSDNKTVFIDTLKKSANEVFQIKTTNDGTRYCRTITSSSNTNVPWNKSFPDSLKGTHRRIWLPDSSIIDVHNNYININYVSYDTLTSNGESKVFSIPTASTSSAGIITSSDYNRLYNELATTATAGPNSNGLMSSSDKSFIDVLKTNKEYSVIKGFGIKTDGSNNPYAYINYITNSSFNATTTPQSLKCHLPFADTVNSGIMRSYMYRTIEYSNLVNGFDQTNGPFSWSNGSITPSNKETLYFKWNMYYGGTNYTYNVKFPIANSGQSGIMSIDSYNHLWQIPSNVASRQQNGYMASTTYQILDDLRIRYSNTSYALKNHTHNYASPTTGPDPKYALLKHTHSLNEIRDIAGKYSPATSVPDTKYALKDHNHDDKYALPTTTPDDKYALKDHNHNDLYNTKSEINTLLTGYSKTSHNHDDRYALKNHSHNYVTPTTSPDSKYITYIWSEANCTLNPVSLYKYDSKNGRVAYLDISKTTAYSNTYSRLKDVIAKANTSAPSNHNHDDRYALKNHTHNYASPTSSPDPKYPSINHTHVPATETRDGFMTSSYVRSLHKLETHNHDDRYSKLGHTHDDRYPLKSHTHKYVAQILLDKSTKGVTSYILSDGSVSYNLNINEINSYSYIYKAVQGIQSNYATQSYVTSKLNNYVQSGTLNNYVTHDVLCTKLSSYATTVQASSSSKGLMSKESYNRLWLTLSNNEATSSKPGLMPALDKKFIDKLKTDKPYSKLTDCSIFKTYNGDVVLEYYSYRHLNDSGTFLRKSIPFANTISPGIISGDTYKEINKISGLSSTLFSLNNTTIPTLQTTVQALSTRIDNLSSVYAPYTHYHDDRYYTESEINTKLGNYASSSHTHKPATTSNNGFMTTSQVSTLSTHGTDISNLKSRVNTLENKTVTKINGVDLRQNIDKPYVGTNIFFGLGNVTLVHPGQHLCKKTGEVQYGASFIISPWNDKTGGKQYKLGFGNGQMAISYGTDTWSTWDILASQSYVQTAYNKLYDYTKELESKTTYISNWIMQLHYTEPPTVKPSTPHVTSPSTSIIAVFRNLKYGKTSESVSAYNTNITNTFNLLPEINVKIWDYNKKKFIYEGSTYDASMSFDLTSYKVNTGFDGVAYISVGWYVQASWNNKSLLNYVLYNSNAQKMYVSYCVDHEVSNYDNNSIYYTNLDDYNGTLNCLLGNVRMHGNGGTPYDMKSWNLCLASPIWKQSGNSKVKATTSDVSTNTYLYQTIAYYNPSLTFNTSLGNKYGTCTKKKIEATDKFYYGKSTQIYQLGIPKNSGFTYFDVNTYTYTVEKRVDTMFDDSALRALI